MINAVAVALVAGGLASCASEEDEHVAVASNGYVVCNAYDRCWRVHRRYTTYPADQAIVYHDEAWWGANQNDTRWHFEADPADDQGYYDRDGVWHPFGP
jgi:hypothetical protein